jgi:hypothetical protein
MPRTDMMTRESKAAAPKQTRPKAREAAAQPHARPFDVMVASFADRKAAKEAYEALKDLEKRGGVQMQGAVVLDRDDMGRVHVQHAKMPPWLWAIVGVAAASMVAVVGSVVWAVAHAISSRMGREEYEE